MPHEPNVAVMEADLKNLADIVHGLVRQAESTRGEIQDLILLARMTQAAQIATDKSLNEDVKPNLKTLLDSQSRLRGAWIAVVGLLSFIGGLAASAWYVHDMTK